jgi:hypothetical protein
LNFKKATDILTSAPAMTLGRIAEAFGKDTHTITRARMEGENARRPPGNWRPVLARLAHSHAGALRAYAKELDRLAEELKGL